MLKKRNMINLLSMGLITAALCAAPVMAEEETEVFQPETGFSRCDSYVYVYADMDRESEIVGKLYTDSLVNVLGEYEYDWTHISSGHVEGYVDSTAIKKGEDADRIAKEVAYVSCVVKADELAVRADSNENAEVITSVNKDDVIEVVDQNDNWAKVVLVGEDGELIYGWVSKEFVEVKTEYRMAVTLEEDELGLIDVDEEETEEEIEEEIYDEEPSYEEPSYQEPSYQEPSYQEPSYNSQPATQAATQPATQAATQPATQAPTEAPAQTETQPATQAPTEAPAATEAPADTAVDAGTSSDTVITDDSSSDEIYVDDGTGDEVIIDDFSDEFYDAG